MKAVVYWKAVCVDVETWEPCWESAGCCVASTHFYAYKRATRRAYEEWAALYSSVERQRLAIDITISATPMGPDNELGAFPFARPVDPADDDQADLDKIALDAGITLPRR